MTLKKFMLLCFALSFVVPIVNAGYYRDALSEYQNNNFDEAIEILEEGLKAAPNDESMARLLGLVYFRVRNIEKAQAAFQKAIELDPEDDVSHYHLGMCYVQQRDANGKPKPAWFEASQAFAKAVELKPDDWRYNSFLGNTLVMQRNFQQALAPLEKAYATEEGQIDYRIATDLGMVYQVMNNNEKAIELFEKAISLDAEKHAPYMYLGNLYLTERLYDKALGIADTLIEIQPDESRGYSIKGQIQLREKKFSAAETSFTKAIQLDPSDASFYYQRGLAREGQTTANASSYQSLIQDYAKAVTLSGSSASSEWHYRLGNAYDMEASLYWDRAVRHAESRSNCLHYLRKARQEFQAAKDHPNAQQQLTVVNERIRQLEALS
jgi:tetratricopeptide (TPR) repeat protein